MQTPPGPPAPAPANLKHVPEHASHRFNQSIESKGYLTHLIEIIHEYLGRDARLVELGAQLLLDRGDNEDLGKAVHLLAEFANFVTALLVKDGDP